MHRFPANSSFQTAVPITPDAVASEQIAEADMLARGILPGQNSSWEEPLPAEDSPVEEEPPTKMMKKSGGRQKGASQYTGGEHVRIFQTILQLQCWSAVSSDEIWKEVHVLLGSRRAPMVLAMHFHDCMLAIRDCKNILLETPGAPPVPTYIPPTALSGNAEWTDYVNALETALTAPSREHKRWWDTPKAVDLGLRLYLLVEADRQGKSEWAAAAAVATTAQEGLVAPQHRALVDEDVPAVADCQKPLAFRNSVDDVQVLDTIRGSSFAVESAMPISRQTAETIVHQLASLQKAQQQQGKMLETILDLLKHRSK